MQVVFLDFAIVTLGLLPCMILLTGSLELCIAFILNIFHLPVLRICFIIIVIIIIKIIIVESVAPYVFTKRYENRSHE